MSSPGVKAGEEIRTPDVQLGKRIGMVCNVFDGRALCFLGSGRDQLGAALLASVGSCCQ